MLLIDAHVHIYDCFDLKKFFDSAYTNFKSAAEKLGHEHDFTGILLLAETSKDSWFYHLVNYANGKDLPESKETGSWIFRRTDESDSLLAESGNSKKMPLIAGRQIVTKEGLEVLALLINERFEDGIPINELILDIKNKGGIPVIPWGFGKWKGRRGSLLNGLLKKDNGRDFYLGDNGNRPSFIPMPSQFILAKERNIPNLPGSDPLPFISEVNRAGCFGSILLNKLPKENPAEHLRRILKTSGNYFQHFGALERPYRFVRNQIASQLRKRLKGIKDIN